MHLHHAFSNETRHLFMYHQYCAVCGCNQNGNGGLEIHHNCNRKKDEDYLDSPLNAVVLCHLHHSHITGSPEERLKFFKHTVKILKQEGYMPTMEDMLFVETHAEDKFRLKPKKLFNILNEA